MLMCGRFLSIFGRFQFKLASKLSLDQRAVSHIAIPHLKATVFVMSSLRNLEEFGKSENSISKYLVGENIPLENGSKMYPRQVKKIHFTHVLPEPAPTPTFIAASKSCAVMLELDPGEFHTERFAQAFAGNTLLPGLDTPYATVYGCHSYGQWFGQLGDGRALSIGEVFTSSKQHQKTLLTKHQCVNAKGTTASTTATAPANSSSNLNATPTVTPTLDVAKDYYSDHVYELQLKGSGRSPYSRGFDGRAVLRSSVREYLGG